MKRGVKEKINKKKYENKKTFFIFLRYLILVVVGIFLFDLFYKFFTPLTVYPFFYLLKLVYKEVFLVKTTVVFNTVSFSIIPACVAGAAYFLLLILNLTTPMSSIKRISSILFSFFLFLAINIFRLFISAVFFLESLNLFKLTHLLFWYFLSGIIVFLVWLIGIKVFRIENLPVYSDLSFLSRLTKYKL